MKWPQYVLTTGAFVGIIACSYDAVREEQKRYPAYEHAIAAARAYAERITPVMERMPSNSDIQGDTEGWLRSYCMGAKVNMQQRANLVVWKEKNDYTTTIIDSPHLVRTPRLREGREYKMWNFCEIPKVKE